MNKNILIISEYFAPQNEIAAIRFTKMVKYLGKTGRYHFHVISLIPYNNDVKDRILDEDIRQVRDWVSIYEIKTDRKILTKRETKGKDDNEVDLCAVISDACKTNKGKGWDKRAKSLLGKFLLDLKQVYNAIFEVQYAHKGYKVIKKIEKNVKIDAVIATYGEIGAFLLALKCRRIIKQGKLIADYRDPIHCTKTKIVDGVCQKICEKIDHMANYITGAEITCTGSGQYPEKFWLIRNGFDSEDLTYLQPKRHNSKLTICYTGLLCEGRSLEPLLRVLSELKRESRIELNNIQIVYAGANFSYLYKQAEKQGLTSILVNKGKIPREAALQLQYEADILVTLSWHDRIKPEIFPAKTLEYFMMRNTVLGLITGDLENSMLKKIIEETGTGYCYETVAGEEKFGYFKEWFLEKYRDFEENGIISLIPNEEKLKEFSSEEMAKKFASLIDNV